MVVNFNQMWVVAREAADAGDDPQSVQALSKILSIKEGRRFISTLDLKDAKLCIEILHHVRSNPPSALRDANPHSSRD